MQTPAEHIRGALLSRIERNPAYSLRALARDMGVSHTYLSLVLNEKKRISPRQATWMADVLGFDGQRTTEFLSAVMDKTPHNRRHRPKTSFGSLELDHLKVLDGWHHFAILDLTLLSTFRPDVAWIAGRLGITRPQVRSAVGRLERLGMLKREADRWTKAEPFLAVPTKRSVAPMRRMHRELILKSLKALASPKQTDFDARLIAGSMIPTNRERLEEAKKIVNRFRKQLIRYLSDGECTELYQLNVQLFPLTRPEKPRPEKKAAKGRAS